MSTHLPKPSVTPMTALESYVRDLLTLHRLRRDGRFDSDEADQLRDRMVSLWRMLTLSERDAMDSLVDVLTDERSDP